MISLRSGHCKDLPKQEQGKSLRRGMISEIKGAFQWWILYVVLNVKKSVTAAWDEFYKPCYLDTCLCVLAIGETLFLLATSLVKLITGESWPLYRAKAAHLFCNGSGTAEEAGKVVVSFKTSSVVQHLYFFELVWFYVNVFSCLWFLEVTTIFSKGRNSRWVVQTQDGSLNCKLNMRGFWWCWWFLCFPV